MPTYIITYDLNKEGADYSRAKEKVEHAIKNIPGAYWVSCEHLQGTFPRGPLISHALGLTTTWIIGTDHPHMTTVHAVYAYVFLAMDENDELLVGELNHCTCTSGQKIRKNLLK